MGGAALPGKPGSIRPSQKLKRNGKDAFVEGTANTRNDTNLHIEPGRDTKHFYQLAQGAKVSVLKRGTVEKKFL